MTVTRKVWHDAYQIELVEMYYIMFNILKKKFPHIEINSEPAFHNFSRLIYHCSSKELSDYTKASLNILDV